jgi:hypothetical protein
MPKFDNRKRAPKTIKTRARKFDRIVCLSLQLFLRGTYAMKNFQSRTFASSGYKKRKKATVLNL